MAGFLALRFSSRLMIPHHIKRNNLSGITLFTARKLSFTRKKSESAVIEPTKSEYEIEYDKVVEKEKFVRSYGLVEGDPYLDKASMHMIMFMGFSMCLVFAPFMLTYGPDFRHRMKQWRTYEALKLIEKREASGEILLNPDFVPADLIESMVPPPGDWEREWLLNQPSVRSDNQSHFYVQAQTW